MNNPLDPYTCKKHLDYDGCGKRPVNGCTRCWYLWLRWSDNTSSDSDADARYIAKLQREHLKQKQHQRNLNAGIVSSCSARNWTPPKPCED